MLNLLTARRLRILKKNIDHNRPLQKTSKKKLSIITIMKKLFLTLFLSAVTALATAQEAPAPKWLSKVQKSIVSVISYDKDKKMIHEGVGYVISADGVAVADYSLFRDAYSAVAVDASGNQSEVERILGADDLYNIIRFRIASKKNTPLTLASSTSTNRGADVFAIGYYGKSKVNVVPKATVEKKELIDSKYAYYSLDSEFDGKQVGKGVFSTQGEFLGIVQSPVGGKCGVVDGAMARDLNVSAIMTKSKSLAYSNIYIKKGLPDNLEESKVYLYFKSRTAGNEEYMDLLNLFIATYPDNAWGYLSRATPYIDLHQFDDADNDLQTYMKLVEDKNQGHADVAKTIYSKLVYMPEPKYDKWTYELAIDHVDQAINGVKAQLPAITDSTKKELAKSSELEYTLLKAQILSAKKDDRGAIAIYDEINAGPYKSPGTFYASSLAHEAAGDSTDIQIAMMDSAIAQFPDPKPQEAASYYLRRAKIYEKEGKFRQAVADYNQFCYLNNNKVSDTFYYDRSQLEVKARMYQQAIDDIDQAVQLAPQNPLYLVEKSAIHLRVNQIDQCIEAAQKCIELSTDYPDAYRILGYAQIQKGDKVSAKKNLERAKELGDETAQEIMDTYLK